METNYTDKTFLKVWHVILVFHGNSHILYQSQGFLTSSIPAFSIKVDHVNLLTLSHRSFAKLFCLKPFVLCT
jgi:hypothetical protein